MKNLKYSGLEVGTVIRAHDFEPCDGRPDSYVEGVICADYANREGVRFYSIDVIVDSSECTTADGKLWTRRSSAHDEWISTNVPHETSFDYDGRIVVLPDYSPEFLATFTEEV